MTSRFQILSPERHKGMAWRHSTRFPFAGNDSVVPLAHTELPSAAMSLPTGFRRNDQGFQLVAIQGLEPGTNTFIDGAGNYLTPYIPLEYRFRPFKLLANNAGQEILCIDEASDDVWESSGTRPGNDFLVDEAPSNAVKDVVKKLAQYKNDLARTSQLAALLDELQLLERWDAGAAGTMSNMFRVNETALNKLPDDAFIRLRAGGTLPVAYCQMLSMQHLQRVKSQQGSRRANIQTLLETNETISFENLK